MTSPFFDPLVRSLSLLLDFLPRFFALLFVLALGYFIARLLRALASWILGAARIDDWARRLGLEAAFAAVPWRRSLRELLADAVGLIVMVFFLVVGLDALDPASTGSLLTSFYGFLPRLLVAALILVSGWLLGAFFSQWALVTAVNARWRLARPLSAVTQVLVIALALAMALEQLGIAQGIVIVSFALTFGGVVLALALAFGIGGADLARRTLERRLGEGTPDETPDEFSHL